MQNVINDRMRADKVNYTVRATRISMQRNAAKVALWHDVAWCAAYVVILGGCTILIASAAIVWGLGV